MELSAVISICSLALAVLLGVERVWSQSSDKTSNRLDTLQEFKAKLEGAEILRRLAGLEESQSSNQSILVRLDQKLKYLDAIMSDIKSTVEERND